jgi:hypothetical protein
VLLEIQAFLREESEVARERFILGRALGRRNSCLPQLGGSFIEKLCDRVPVDIRLATLGLLSSPKGHRPDYLPQARLRQESITLRKEMRMAAETLKNEVDVLERVVRVRRDPKASVAF